MERPRYPGPVTLNFTQDLPTARRQLLSLCSTDYPIMRQRYYRDDAAKEWSIPVNWGEPAVKA